MILGITGTDGAGKGTVVDYLVKEQGFIHYSSRDFIVAEIDRQGLPVTRNQMRLTANEMRAEHGNDFVIRQAFERAKAEGEGKIVIESVRAQAEAEFLQRHGGILIAIDADSEIRYARVQERRSASDQVSYEEFVAHEELERNDPDPHGMQKATVIAMANYTLTNNGTVEELHAQIDDVLQKIAAK